MRSAATALALTAAVASAHLMPAQQGTLNVVGDSVFEVVSLPVSAFPGVDDDGDGQLSEAELAAHEAALVAAVSRGYRLFDGDEAGALELALVRAEHDERSEDGAAGAPTLVAMLKTRFRAPPRQLRLETSLFGEGPAAQLTIKATRGPDVEVAVLTPRRASHAFFRPPAVVFADAAATGVEHLLLGVDHLLFLLTLVVAVRGARAWLTVLTSFTVAHGLTLTAALLGWAHAPARLVEPAIAASIVVMAVVNLGAPALKGLHRAGLVFAFGLLHGLGFASALAALGLGPTHRALVIVGLNVGIELGQAAFVAAALGLGAALRLTLRDGPGGGRLRLAVSGVTGLCGAAWFVERLVGG
ncbi:MAG: HupE/UreJ family protein [Myxococcaceae bacterium]|nr:HupE/UreJ family protein [Myxococcaceae bacterium]MCA3010836.1 HupE/UreJ family protein [Myxococcaceae bacterium]